MSGIILNLTDITTSLPVLEEGTYFARITSATTKKTKKSTDLFVISYELIGEEFKSYEGETVTNTSPGFSVFDQMPLTPTEKLSAKAINTRLAKLINAVSRDEAFNKECGFSSIEEIAEFIKGKFVKLSIKRDIDKTGEYPDKNRVAAVLAIKESDQFNEPA